MTSPLAAIDAIFNRPRDAAAVLFLIEDSNYMNSLWQGLRDSYLPSLLAAIESANPAASVSPFTPALPHPPITILQAEALWMIASEFAPFKPPFNPSTRRTPRWDDIPVINFSTHGGSTISPANLTHATEVRQTRFNRLRSDTRLLFRRCRVRLAVNRQRAISSLSPP